MYRYLIGAIAAALVAGLLGWHWYRQEQAEHQRD